MRTIILGGRGYGKTTVAMKTASAYQDTYKDTKVTVLHPNRALAVIQAKLYPSFEHYGIEDYLHGHVGISLEAKSLYVIEEISHMPEHWLANIEAIACYFETIYTVTPRFYNAANVPEWVKVYQKCDTHIILNAPEHLKKWVQDLADIVPAHQAVEHYNVLPAYKITDIELPEELEHLKEGLIEGLNRNAPKS